MVLADIVLTVALLAVTSLVDYGYYWPRFRAALAAGDPAVRMRIYRLALGQWLWAAAAIAIWTLYARPWPDLGLSLPQGWRLALSIGYAIAATAFLALQLWSVARLSPEQRAAARPTLGAVALVLPHTAAEHRWFLAVSVTAGVCEELLWRGYLPWFFAPWLGNVGAMVAMVLVFGIAHIYQGWQGAFKAILVGAVMVAIVLSTGSLLPAMVAHTLTDIGGGTVGYWLLREATVPAPAPAAVPQTSTAGRPRA